MCRKRFSKIVLASTGVKAYSSNCQETTGTYQEVEMSEYLDFLEECEYRDLADLATEHEAAQLVRECRAGLNALDAFEEEAELNGYRAR